MIFVTVGNYLPFPRLVNAVDQLKAQGVIGDEVLLQVGGASDFRSERCKVARFLPPDEFERAVREASVIVSHPGCGTLIQVLGAGKVPVVMPRRRQYGEHVDDHQIELARALAAEGRVILADEVRELPQAIERARSQSACRSVEPPTRLVKLVSQAINEILASNGET
jgi:UDP-N-acetylglucosamine transferase subunit ALG13